MSSHTTDLSGQRTLQVTMNDPARTATWMPAKAGDDVIVQLGGFRELRIQIPENARIQRRTFVSRTQRVVDGKAVRDEDGSFVYDEHPYEGLVLVLTGSAAVFGRASALEGEEAVELTPHTGVSVRRMPDPYFTESGELAEELEVRDLLAREETTEG